MNLGTIPVDNPTPILCIITVRVFYKHDFILLMVISNSFLKLTFITAYKLIILTLAAVK